MDLGLCLLRLTHKKKVSVVRRWQCTFPLVSFVEVATDEQSGCECELLLKTDTLATSSITSIRNPRLCHNGDPDPSLRPCFRGIRRRENRTSRSTPEVLPTARFWKKGAAATVPVPVGATDYNDAVRPVQTFEKHHGLTIGSLEGYWNTQREQLSSESPVAKPAV